MTNNQEQDVKIEHVLTALRTHIGELAQESAIQKATIISLTAVIDALKEEKEQGWPEEFVEDQPEEDVR